MEEETETAQYFGKLLLLRTREMAQKILTDFEEFSAFIRGS